MNFEQKDDKRIFYYCCEFIELDIRKKYVNREIKKIIGNEGVNIGGSWKMGRKKF